jgi:2-C-methyl-D-erythritol 4-phosphate cytidylyltransferase
MNTAIIVAAGFGTRFNSDKPKQFVELLGKPLIIHTVERFQQAATIDSIILVLAEDRIDEFKGITSGHQSNKLSKIVAGGSTRAESVLNGLNAIDDASEIAAVHDGARPLVTPAEIDAVVERAAHTGAACLVAAIDDTIKTIQGNEIGTTLDRTKLRRSLTPQAFKIQVLRRSFENAVLDDSVTDECYLVEKLGHPIAFVEGNPMNIKVTRSADLVIAEAFLRFQKLGQNHRPD